MVMSMENRGKIEELNLKANEPVLLHNHCYGVKTWEFQMGEVKSTSLTIVNHNQKEQLSFDKGEEVKLSVTRGNTVVRLYCRLLKMTHTDRKCKLILSLPCKIQWREMKERRHERVRTDISAEISTDGEHRWYPVRIKDISESGLCILSNKPLKKGEKVLIFATSSELTQGFIGRTTRLGVLDRRAKEGSINYNIGVEFCEISPHNSNTLSSYIGSNAQRVQVAS